MLQTDVGAWIKGALSLPLTQKGTTNDGSAITGNYLDRIGYYSCKVGILVQAALTDNISVTVTGVLKDAGSSTGLSAADHGSSTGSVEVGSTGSTYGAAAQNGELWWDVDLSGAERYIAVAATPTIGAATSTDTVSVMGVIILGGRDTLPASTQ